MGYLRGHCDELPFEGRFAPGQSRGFYAGLLMLLMMIIFCAAMEEDPLLQNLDDLLPISDSSVPAVPLLL